jgi:hypothetical protein
VDSEGRLPAEGELRRRLDAFDPRERVELLRVLELPDEDRAAQIGAFYAQSRLLNLAKLVMDLEDDPVARAFVITELRIMTRQDG